MPRIPWNKGLTKDIDERVAASSRKMKETKTGVSIKHSGQFKKGFTPWNKGKKYTEKEKSKMNLSGLQVGRGYFKGQMIKKNYANIHYWVRKQKGKAKKCEHCGTTKGRIEWANIDHKYHQRVDDYISLCVSCHNKYDKKC